MEGEPIKNKRLSDLANAPTPQNTPATATSSFANRAAPPSIATIQEEGAGAQGPLGLANNPALLSMIQGKLGTLVGRPSGYIDSLPQAVKNRISGLKGIQLEHSKLEAEFQQELLALEKKYFKKYEPLYQRRAKIIEGNEEPTDVEVQKGKEWEAEHAEHDEDDDDEEDEAEEVSKKLEELDVEDEEADDKGIPEFWLNALRNLVPAAETISDRDEDALRFLTDIRMEYLEVPGFALVFEFSENPFFTNKELRKTYYYREETGYAGDYIYDHAEGDVIDWKSSENNLTVRVEKRKQRNKHTKATRTIEKTIPAESFFQFFSPPKTPGADGEDEDEDEEIAEDLEARLEFDYNLGEEIKDKLIPRAVDWYTGEALEYEDLEDFDDGFDNDQGDSDLDDDDDSDEGEGEAAGEGKEGECKQQ